MKIYKTIESAAHRRARASQHKPAPMPRPLIGVPTWRDCSQVYAGVAICAMNQLYLEAIEQAGGLPILIPLHLDSEGLHTIFERLDGLFLAGGEDIAPQAVQATDQTSGTHPLFDRDETELTLTRWALAAQLPILGICRGMQLINVASGGTLYQDLGDQRPDLCKHDYFGPHFARDRISHDVELARGSMLYDLYGPSTGVNSLHHQGVAHIGKGLTVIAWSTTARSTDGLPEAIQSTSDEGVLGIQWHPEALLNVDARHAGIFRYFVEKSAMHAH